MTELPLGDADTMAASQYFFRGLRSVLNGEPNASYAGFREVGGWSEPRKGLTAQMTLRYPHTAANCFKIAIERWSSLCRE